MTGHAPLISVVMPVRNGEPFVRAAIDSILSQTFTNFECLVINDGSTDGRQAVLDAGGYRDASWPVEDYDLWRRILNQGRAANLPHVLYRYLVNPDGVCARQPELQRERLREVLANVRKSIPFTSYDWRRVVA